jgi:hypothetical protein
VSCDDFKCFLIEDNELVFGRGLNPYNWFFRLDFRPFNLSLPIYYKQTNLVLVVKGESKLSLILRQYLKEVGSLIHRHRILSENCELVYVWVSLDHGH